MSTWQKFLQALFEQHQPSSVLAVGNTLRAWLADQTMRGCLVDELPADMALLDQSDFDIPRIAYLRDRCPFVVVLTQSSDETLFNTFLSLGFERRYQSVGQNMDIYVHDIATYKATPDWLNAKYWAHPERWEP